MDNATIRELVEDAKGHGPLARLAACQLAAIYRARLGYAPLSK